MSIGIHTVGNVSIIRPEGKITIGANEAKPREMVETCLAAGKKNLLVDLGNVGFMDSSGLGDLVGCLITVTNRGGKLKLLNVPKKIHDLLVIARLIPLFEVYQDEKDALGSFGP